jgi:hypothetical protein
MLSQMRQPPSLTSHTSSTLLKLQTIPNTLPHPLLKLWCVVPPQARGFDIGGRFVVGAGEHGYNGEENGFGCLNGRPAFCGGFVAVLVFFWRVQDRDAYFAVLVDCSVLAADLTHRALSQGRRTVWVEYGCLEAHLWW